MSIPEGLIQPRCDTISITAILWSSFVPMFLKVAKEESWLDLKIYSHKTLSQGGEILGQLEEDLTSSHLVFLYLTHDPFWSEVEGILSSMERGPRVVSVSADPIKWGRLSTEDLSICSTAYEYLSLGGEDNTRNLLRFLGHIVDDSIGFEAPRELPFEGIIRPPDLTIFETIEDYWRKYPPSSSKIVGILFSRNILNYSSRSLESTLIHLLEEKGLSPLPIFSHWRCAPELGARGPLEACKRFFLDQRGRPIISALINLQYFPLNTSRGEGDSLSASSLFKSLNVPVFKPVISYGLSREEWEDSPVGLTSDITFGIALPEFEGNIEPIVIGCSDKRIDPDTGCEFEETTLLEERLDKMVQRISRWIDLALKPPEQRRLVFVIHKNECASLEATLGSAAGLDSGESIIRIFRELKKKGYKVEDIPSSGEELFRLILEKKAIAEFRWTTVEEIVSRGGAIYLMDKGSYGSWFEKLPSSARARIVEAWGEPPGRELNGVPPAMIYNGKIVITGLRFGNVLVMMQPKRGCAGPRCDGRVCKILHDPDIPPPHQYLASYLYMEKIFQADVIVHVGTHGNLEWLPGKGAGLSESCWPDIAIGDVPHLYIYNSDNPAEAVVAKRRSYATIVDHLQAVLATSGLYGEMQVLDELLGEYARAAHEDRARAHEIRHEILEQAKKANILDITQGEKDFETLLEEIHQMISRIKNSQTKTSLHVFGKIPNLTECAQLINTILRFDTSRETNTLRIFFELWGEDLERAISFPQMLSKQGIPYGELLHRADKEALLTIESLLQGKGVGRERELPLKGIVDEISERIRTCKEIDSLLNALDGGFVEPGPSGFISRGRYDILPTGRNMYNVDPSRVPTRAAQQVGEKLAEALLLKYKKDHGRYPQKIALVWMASDIMRADGEQLSQMLYLIGVRPRWRKNGEVNGFEIIPLQELDRPRIDIHVRVSGILRDSFPHLISYLDEAICAVAQLDESEEENFIRANILASARRLSLDPAKEEDLRRLSYRIFCAQPGVYRAGVNLAIYASAWKEKKDLSNIYIYWNGYAYGGDPSGKHFGVPAHRELVRSLEDVDITFDKHISDETDFLHCCGFFSNYGGLTVAVEEISGKKPATYYGDTREVSNVQVVEFSEEITRVVKAKLFNPIYIEGMKKHGYRGAADISKKIGRLYGFASTTGEVRDWVFEEVAEKFVLDEEMSEWFKQVNPWAMEEIIRRLLEASSRGIWKAREETLGNIKGKYLELEGILEESLSSTHQDFQGSSVDIFSVEEIEQWQKKLYSLLKGEE